MAATVGLDWGLVALGINCAPPKEREPAVSGRMLTGRYGKHAAITTIPVDTRHRIDSLRQPIGSSVSVMTDVLIQLTPSGDDAVNRASNSVRVVHDVTSSDQWLPLTGDAEPPVGSDIWCNPHMGAPELDWLVVRDDGDRDIITVHGQDA